MRGEVVSRVLGDFAETILRSDGERRRLGDGRSDFK
jgi:hypothetical protein